MCKIYFNSGLVVLPIGPRYLIGVLFQTLVGHIVGGFVCLFRVCQVDRQVVGEPPAPCSEGLRLGDLQVPHNFEPVGDGLEVDDLVVPCLELSPGS